MVNIYNEYIPKPIRKITIYIREKAPNPIKKIAIVIGKIVEKIINHITDRKYWLKKSNIVKDYYKHKSLTKEEKKAIRFLKINQFFLDTNKLMYLSNNVNRYKRKLKKTKVFFDKNKNLHYLTHDNKRLYFPRLMPEKQILNTYFQFLSEMDKDSPHLYTNDINELKGKVLFDCGVAEGLFPLTFINHLKKIVLFECDNNWVEALRATFAPYSDKVTIVQKYVSDTDSNNTITLDSFSKTNNIIPDFIKMDIEGFEEKAIKGATNILKNDTNTICAICTYHTPYAEKNIITTMNSLGFRPKYNKGYMIFHCEEPFSSPYLRRGVVRFYKKQNTNSVYKK